MGAPTKPLPDAIAEYQAKHPYSQQAFEGLFTDLTQQGYHVARTTHAANTLASDDALVDSGGNVYDLVFNTGGADARWQANPAGSYDPSRSVVGPDGKFLGFADWAKANGGSGETTPAPATTPASSTAAAPQTVLGQGGLPWQRVLQQAQAAVAKAKAINAASPMGNSPSAASSPYAAAAAAAARGRMTGNRGGRRSTVLGGFGSGAPSTRPATVLGA